MSNSTWFARLFRRSFVTAHKRRPFRHPNKTRSCLKLEWLEDRITPSQNMWTGSVSNQWNNASNWSAGIPGTGAGVGQDVVISSAVNTPIIITGISPSIDSITSSQPIDLEGQTLTLTGGGTPATGGLTFTNSAALTITGGGLLNFTTNNQTLTGDGTGAVVFGDTNASNAINVASGVQLTVSTGGSAPFFTVEAGTATVTGNGVLEGAGTFVNKGILESQDGGTLVVQSTVTTSGTILATGAGSTVTLNASNISGNTLTTTSGGVIENNGSATLNGITVSSGSTLTLLNDTTTVLKGTITNQGNIAENSSGSTTDIQINGAVSLSGGGTLTMSNTSVNRIYSFNNSASDTLTNAGNTIQGAGQIGIGQNLTLVNQATIDATGSQTLTIQAAGGETNTGTLEATGGGQLVVAGVVANAGGTIQSTASGSIANLGGSGTINGGTLTTSTAGVVENGGTATLNGVTISSGSTLTLLNDTTTVLKGTITNQGNIAENSSGSTTDIQISGAVSLSGGGTLTMSNTSVNRIYSLNNSASDTLTNAGNTIQGAGQIGIGQNLTLVNQATIDATGSQTLTIQAAGGETNTGTLEATGGGQLVVAGVVANAGGTIQSTGSGSVANLGGSGTINGGTLTTSTAGVVENGGTATLNGVTISSGSTLTLLNDTTTVLKGTITNQGNIAENSSGSTTDIQISGAVSLTGGGTLTMSNTTNNRIFSLNDLASDALTNVNNTIQGAGEIGIGQNLTLNNQATIDANQSNQLTILAAGGDTNSGTFEATAGGQLLVAGVVTNTGGGTILSTGTNSVVSLSTGTINGGTLTTSSNGALFVGGGTLNGVTNTVTISSGSTVTLQNGAAVTLEGTLTNNGTLAVASGGSDTDVDISGTVTITGGGSVTMSNNSNNRILGSGGTLINDTNNTIQGAGQIGAGGTLVLNNKGTIDGNQSNALTLNLTGGVANSGTLEATAGGTLALPATVNNSSTGVVVATDTNSVIALNGVTINGGTLTTNTLNTSTPGVIENNGTATLNGITISSGSTLTIINDTTTTLKGTITNQGNIAQNSSGSDTDILISGAVSLSGGGTLTMSNFTTNRIYSAGNVASDALTNAANTIQGAGQIGIGQNLTLINQATIDANKSGTLTIQAVGGDTNTGTFEATAAGQLVVAGVVTNTGGTILSTGAGSVANLSGGTINGGTLTTASSGTMFAGNSTLNGVTISPGSTVTVQNDTEAFLQGTITNNGTLFDDSTGSDTDILLLGNVTLSGNGTLLMGNNANNRIFGNTGSEQLTNSAGHTIAGSGQLGIARLSLINNGTILANQSNTLLIQPIAAGVTNNGTMQVASGSVLDVTGGGGLTNFAGSTLTGGTYLVAGTFQFDNANIVTNAATVVLNGASSAIVNQSSANGIANFTTNAAAGNFTLQNGRNLTTPTTVGTFTNAGNLTVDATVAADTFAASGAYTQTGGTTTLIAGAASPTLKSNTNAVNINGGTLHGTGNVTGNVTVSGAGTTVAPGTAAAAGIIAIGGAGAGNFTMNNGTILTIKLTGPNTSTPVAGTDFDQVSATGTVTLNTPTLNGVRTTSYVPAVGTQFKIIANTGGSAISMNFNNLVEGSTDTIGGVFFKVTYLGGNGHDAVLTTLAPPTVYVDTSFAGTAAGSDPATDNIGNLVFGYNAFSDIQSSINAVAVGGTVVVYSSTYSTNNPLHINKSLTEIDTAINPKDTSPPNTVTLAEAVILANSVTFNETGANGGTGSTAANLTFGSTVDDTTAGTDTLTIAGSQTATFAAAVGGTTALAALIDNGTTTDLNTGTVTTTQTQIYSGAVVVADSVGTATLSAGVNITLNSGASITTHNSNLNLQANTAGTASGVFNGISITTATIQSTGTGNISLHGQGAANNSSSQNIGILILNGGVVEATGSGNVTLNGTGGNAVNNDFGEVLFGSGTRVSTVNGTLSITGTGQGTGSNGEGMDIQGGAVVQATGTGNVALVGTGANGTGNDFGVNVTGGSVSTNSGALSITGNGGGTGTNNPGVAVQNSGGSVTTVSGALSITGTGSGNGTENDGVIILSSSVVQATGIGTVTVLGTGGNGSSGAAGVVVENTGTVVSTVSGALAITGTGGGTGSIAEGIDVEQSGVVEATGSGNVTLIGTGANGTSQNEGVRLFSSGTIVSVASGALTITGTGQGSGTQDYGVEVESSAVVQATGSGTIALTGTAPGNTAAISFNLQSGVTGFLTAGSGNVTLTGDIIDLATNAGAPTVTSSGGSQLLFQPLTASRPIILGGNDVAGSLVYTDTDNAAIAQGGANGFSLVTIGRANSSGAITTGNNVTFGANAVVQTPNNSSGGATVSNTLNAGANSLTVNSGTNISTSGAGLLQAGNLALQAVTGIGSVGTPLNMAAGTLTANTSAGNGNQFLKETGTAKLSAVTALNAGTGSITLTNGTFQIQGSAGGNAIADTSPLVVNSPAILDLAGNNESVDFGGSGTVTDTGANATLTIGASNGGGTWSGVIQDGTGHTSVNKIGTGTEIFSGANTYSGGTQVSQGTLQLGANNSLPVGGAVTIGDANGDSGVLDLNGFNQAVTGVAFVGPNATTTALTLGAGTLTLNGTLSYSVPHSNVFPVIITATGAGHIDLGGAVRNVNIGSGNNAHSGLLGDIQVDAPIQNGGIFYTGTLNTNPLDPATLTLGAVNTYTLGTTVAQGQLWTTVAGALPSAGVLTLGTANSATPGAVDLRGNTQTVAGITLAAGNTGGTANVITTSSGSPTFNVDNSITFSYGGALTGGLALLKTGSADLSLTAADTYSGTTTVNGGTLLVDGSTAAASAVTVNVADLGGSGTISGTVAVDSGGTLIPGDSPGTGILDTGSVTFNAGATFLVEIGGLTAGSQYDQLNVNGTANLGGTITAQLINSFQPSLNNSFQVLTFTNETGDFSFQNGFNLPNSLKFQEQFVPTNNPTQLNLVVVSNGQPSIIASSGSGQSATVNTAFAMPLVATVLDGNGNPIGGVQVTFTAPNSGPSGTFSGNSLTFVGTTNASGQVTTSTFTANTVAGGPYTVTAAATVTGVPLHANFTETNTADQAASITMISGSGQSATVNTAFTNQLVAIVTDRFGNPVPGVSVTFAGPGSGASATFATNPVMTGANGLASDAATANTIAGAYTATATVNGIATPANFSLTNTAGTPSSITEISGSPQSTTVNTGFANPLVASVTDGFGNPVPGVNVTFAGPGSGASATFATNPVTTGANGVASDAATANTIAGAYTATATVNGVATPANFSLTNTAGTPSSITEISGSPQSTTVNTGFANPLVASVTDGFGNPVPGVNVTFAGLGSGASATFATNPVTTGANGLASDAATANTIAGAYTATATVNGVATPANFSLTNTAGTPSSITEISGSPQSTTVNTGFANPLVASVTDGFGNPVPGVNVTFAGPGSGASATFATNPVTTGANGLASDAATANTIAGAYTATATVNGIATPANFSLTNTAGTPSSITEISGSPQSTTVNTGFANPLVASVTDGFGNPVPGVNVTFAGPGSGASATFATNPVTTGANGLASDAATANTIAGAYSATATVNGVATPANFSLTNTAGTPSSITETSGSPQNTTVNTGFANPLVAIVKDGFGNPVPGVNVTFAGPTSGASATFATNPVTTGANGQASDSATANGTAGGPYTVTAAVSGILTPANFSLTNTTAAQGPTVVVDDGTVQRSMLRSLTVTFAGATIITPNMFALTIHNAANNGSVSVGGVTGNADGVDLIVGSSQVVNGTTVVVLTFSGSAVVGGSLPDGRYMLSFQGVTVTVTNFWRLFGDAMGQAEVTTADQELFNTAYGSRRGQKNYNSIFDYDSNGYITGADRGALQANLGMMLDANGFVVPIGS